MELAGCYNWIKREFKVPPIYEQIRNAELNLQIDTKLAHSLG